MLASAGKVPPEEGTSLHTFAFWCLRPKYIIIRLLETDVALHKQMMSKLTNLSKVLEPRREAAMSCVCATFLSKCCFDLLETFGSIAVCSHSEGPVSNLLSSF